LKRQQWGQEEAVRIEVKRQQGCCWQLIRKIAVIKEMRDFTLLKKIWVSRSNLRQRFVRWLERKIT